MPSRVTGSWYVTGRDRRYCSSTDSQRFSETPGQDALVVGVILARVNQTGIFVFRVNGPKVTAGRWYRTEGGCCNLRVDTECAYKESSSNGCGKIHFFENNLEAWNSKD